MRKPKANGDPLYADLDEENGLNPAIGKMDPSLLQISLQGRRRSMSPSSASWNSRTEECQRMQSWTHLNG